VSYQKLLFVFNELTTPPDKVMTKKNLFQQLKATKFFQAQLGGSQFTGLQIGVQHT